MKSLLTLNSVGVLLGAVVCLGAVGCGAGARLPDQYKADTRTLLETRNGDIKACYDAALAQDKNLSGKVVVHFMVEAETGMVKEAAVLPESTAPETLSSCIVNAISGLTLDPPDINDGDATFMWEFQAG
jgi:hypothetical protein